MNEFNNLETPKKEILNKRHLSGLLRLVSEVEAQHALETGRFLSQEYFEVWDGKIPPDAYLINTSDSGFDPYIDYRKTLFIPSSIIESKPDIKQAVEKRGYHHEYQEEYPAVSVSGMLQFEKGEIVDITEQVRKRLLGKGLIGQKDIPLEKITELSTKPIVDP
jgi:hypothetical protein